MGNIEIPKWLEGLPLAPVFRPTDTEFADPIAYISKIEKEASSFGICKIIPPLPKPSKKYVLSNLNRSLSKCPDLDNQVSLQNVDFFPKSGCGEKGSVSEIRALFTTRQQELGQNMKKMKGAVNNPPLGAHKQVWQSGETYTLEQFEAKSKAFARSLLGAMKEVSPIDIEALFWQTSSEKPIYVEYANDVPGSAFGEPEGQFHYLHRRRRRRTKTYYQRSRESSCGKKNVEYDDEFCGIEVRDSSPRDSLALSEVTTSNALLTMSPKEIYQARGKTSPSIGSEVEGTAGWKLSNSPWNLQTIARSPGSLTRFMPDDIPGVTSPMVYVGMLFSWFAWHVEDHELHSMNFLHMGSPKTWYSVPGDHAFAFEEVIHSEAYGGNIDRLAALTLLGEKTTLLSPEIIVSSGIPCCRLVQYPGEFVVTFPRAYHVGFSHGFNCGEAANFATSRWLRFAKEAAIRRAAMNYLPMLSHQQLLYLLTMSFVARVPRSLLPGARSSRLRDRQREEREHLVKKAFVQDILKENSLLSSLLDEESGSHAVVWNPDLLPSISRESQLVDRTALVAITSEENMPNTSQSNSNPMNLFKEMSLYMESLNDLYVDKDDLLFDFQVDSGALVCAACGILGFPFMSVMQPAEIALAELLPADYTSLQLHDNPVSAALCEHGEEATKESAGDGWNTCNKFLKPRVFCLEHAIQIKKLLQSKGGVNMLVICHSDYQKIKAYAAAIAEETRVPFNYEEIPLLSASEQELKLIDLAIEDEDNGGCAEDWTSKLGINLRYCVKVRKIFPSKQVQHALSLGGLFTDENFSQTVLTIKWQSRKSRSKLRSENLQNCKSSKSPKNEEESKEKFDDKVVKKEEKLLHYRRRNFRLKSNVLAQSSSCEHSRSQPTEEALLTICGEGDRILRVSAKPSLSCTTNKVAGAAISAVTDLEHEVQVVEATTNEEYDLVPDKLPKSLPSSTLSTENIEVEVINQIPEKMEMKQEASESAKEDGHDEMPEKVGFSIKKNVNTSSLSTSVSVAPEYIGDVHVNHREIMEIDMDESHDLPSDDQCIRSGNVQKAEGVLKVSHANANVCLEKAVVFEEDSTTMALCKEVASVGEVHEKEPSVIHNSSSQCLPEHTDYCTDSVEDDSNVVSIPSSHGERDLSNGSHAREEIECVRGIRDEDAASCLRTAIASDGPASVYEHSHIPHSADESTDVTRITSIEEHTLHSLAPNNECQHADNPIACPENVCQIASDRTTKESLDVDGSLNDDLQLMLGSSSLREMPTPSVQKHDESCGKSIKIVHNRYDSDVSSSHDGVKQEKTVSATDLQLVASGKKRKGKHEIELVADLPINGFIRSPCEGLRSRNREDGVDKSSRSVSLVEEEKPAKRIRQPSKDGISKRSSSVSMVEEEQPAKRTRQLSKTKTAVKDRKQKPSGANKCTLEGCRMSFNTKEELFMHKRNRCPHEGCGKKFRSHKYLVNHQRVHEDDRPLKCPWKGCSMTFKWAWARTEHIRVHTGERPYTCKVKGCGLSFRFVSDYSRHRRKTGHYVNS